MISKLKNISIKGHRYYVIGISNNGNVLEYQLLEILFKNNELIIESRFFSNNFDELFKEKLTKDYPVILHVEGSNIINKQVENKAGYRNDLIFKADLNEFHFFEYHQKEQVFISVTRKQNIDTIIKQISDINLYVIHLSFGSFVMANLLPIIKEYDEIASPNYILEITNNEILSFKNEQTINKVYVINGDRLNERELPLLASFFDYKFPNPVIDFDTGFLTENSNEFKFKKLFKIAGIFALIFFFVSLLASHFLMDFYLNALAEKKSEYVLAQQTIDEVNALKDEKKLKEKILQTSGISNKSFITKYVADIGNSVLSDITLNTIEVIPPQKKIKPREKINFKIGIITIKGEATNDTAFNNWLKKLEDLLWIQKIDIDDYTQQTKKTNAFIIKIKI
ncbi:PilN domain-containing protein [Flavivirga aquimarina]|uniref:PilN domain-containing protein n=1 Tax=Flavivirga aquimarina TaxID=2027862 RepID=A0ABT8W7B9_9FLAO|nr:PilN domain-containing protein [Flavivirga aquimarina]MDO5968996.1 PilN domain-containing protein [Flavivirga aquimarina]